MKQIDAMLSGQCTMQALMHHNQVTRRCHKIYLEHHNGAITVVEHADGQLSSRHRKRDAVVYLQANGT